MTSASYCICFFGYFFLLFWPIFIARLSATSVNLSFFSYSSFSCTWQSRNETALLVTDLLFNINPAKANIIARLLGCVGPLRVSRLGKLIMIASQPKLATWLRWVSSVRPRHAVVVLDGFVRFCCLAVLSATLALYSLLVSLSCRRPLMQS